MLGGVDPLQHQAAGLQALFAGVLQRDFRAEGQQVFLAVGLPELEPLGVTSMYKPSPSNTLYGFSRAFAFLTRISVSRATTLGNGILLDVLERLATPDLYPWWREGIRRPIDHELERRDDECLDSS
jgi:hypothetical protein